MKIVRGLVREGSRERTAAQEPRCVVHNRVNDLVNVELASSHDARAVGLVQIRDAAGCLGELKATRHATAIARLLPTPVFTPR